MSSANAEKLRPKTGRLRPFLVLGFLLILLAIPVTQVHQRIYGALFAKQDNPTLQHADAESGGDDGRTDGASKAVVIIQQEDGDQNLPASNPDRANAKVMTESTRQLAPNGIFSQIGSYMLDTVGYDLGQKRILPEADQSEPQSDRSTISASIQISAKTALYPDSPLSLLNIATAANQSFIAMPMNSYASSLTIMLLNMKRILENELDADSFRPPVGGENQKKFVYLTIDDGPSSLTRQYLDILNANNVRATFFVIGRNAKRYPDRIREMREKGHCVANHSYTHNYEKIYKNSKSLISELNQWEKTISDILGEEYRSGIFRFPGGSTYKSAAKYKAEVIKQGYRYYDWNCLNGDAQIKDKSEKNLYDYMLSTFKNQDEVILLMHDTDAKQTSVNMLDMAINFFISKGYEFRTLDEK